MACCVVLVAVRNLRILDLEEGCGGIVADGKQARKQRRGAVVRGAGVQPTKSPSRAAWYRVTRAAGLALNEEKGGRGNRSIWANQWPGATFREGKNYLLTKKKPEGVRGSGVASVRVLNFPASPARSYMSLMQCDVGPQPRAKAK